MSFKPPRVRNTTITKRPNFSLQGVQAKPFWRVNVTRLPVTTMALSMPRLVWRVLQFLVTRLWRFPLVDHAGEMRKRAMLFNGKRMAWATDQLQVRTEEAWSGASDVNDASSANADRVQNKWQLAVATDGKISYKKQ